MEKKYKGLSGMDKAFYENVYAEVAKIPSGRVCTYGRIAELAGYPNASREVGIAMSKAPSELNLPCHRVVNKKGTLAPSFAFGSQEVQRGMLLSEGITFKDDGTINVGRHMWPDAIAEEQLRMF